MNKDFRIPLLCLFAFVVANFVPAARSATIIVTDVSDNPAAPIAGSLRRAIADAADGDEIRIATGGTITLGGASLILTKNLAITGPGAHLLTISGNNKSRILTIPPGKTVTVSGVSIRRGNGLRAFVYDNGGGGIWNEGTLAISRCTIAENFTNVDGGGIHNTGSLSLENSTVSFNRTGSADAGGFGAGIYSSGTLTLAGSTISYNVAGDGFPQFGRPGGNGGGIWANAAQLFNCTITLNRAGNGSSSWWGGGSAGGSGGGLLINSGGITACTFVENEAGRGGPLELGQNPGSDGVGGAIYITGSAVTMRNTVISQGTVSRFLGTLTSGGFNFVEKGATGIVNGVNGDRAGTSAAPLDARLGPLANSGGLTLTRTPLSGSPLVDGGDDSLALTGTDQRGLPRLSLGHVDIGSVEVSTPPDEDNDGLLDSWELAHWGTTTGHSPTDDFDGDGLTELMEEAFGLDPKVSDGANPIVPKFEEGYLTITFTKRLGVTYEPQGGNTPDSFIHLYAEVLVDDLTTFKVRTRSRLIRVKVTGTP